jgi:hypothetical protein
MNKTLTNQANERGDEHCTVQIIWTILLAQSIGHEVNVPQAKKLFYCVLCIIFSDRG